jgi:hypothetical protein
MTSSPHNLAPQYRRFEFPWTDLEAQLASSGTDRIRILFYGALIDIDHARLTFPDNPPDSFAPVVAHGVQRIFEYRIADRKFHRYGEPPTGNDRAALNARFTGNPADTFNALATTIRTSEFPSLRERETGYGLQMVPFRPWNEPEAPLRDGFVLSALSTETERKELLPFVPYVELCRAGCRKIGPEFERGFVESCYLADQQTTLAEWICS